MNESPRHLSLTLNGMIFTALSVGQEDGPLVVLLHGFPEFADAWAEIMPQLAGAGFRVVALDQRGYSLGARPLEVSDYDAAHLTSDVLALAEALGAPSFHLIGHDWGGFLAWRLGAQHPERVRSLAVLSTPHTDAFRDAVASDPDQQAKSQYIQLFRMPGHVAETMLLADDAARLRSVYQGKLSAAQVESNVRRLAEPGVLTAALNWYRALKRESAIGKVRVPTLYIWGDQDLALGRVAAEATANFVDASYIFEVLAGQSHWLLEDAPEQVGRLLLQHLRTVERVP